MLSQRRVRNGRAVESKSNVAHRIVKHSATDFHILREGASQRSMRCGMRLRIAILLFLFAFQFFGIPSAIGSPATDDLNLKLNTRVKKYNPGVLSFVEALVRVSDDFQIPMGIAWVSDFSARVGLALSWEHATIREIIDAIVKTQPGYQATARNGVVEVSAPGLLPETENFLGKRIKAFELRDEYLERASFKLHNLITPPAHAGFSLGAAVEPRISLELRDSTVQEILDALILASKRKTWIVTFGTDLTPAGFRRTKSLFTEAAVPDDDQPVWYLHHWGDPMPPLLTKKEAL